MRKISASPENESRAPKRIGLWGSMRFRDFRLLWIGLLISNVGTWTQFTTIGYFVVKLAPSPALGSLYIGFLGASRAVPVILASPIAGVIADRYPRRRILLITNGCTAAAAFLVAVLTATNHISIYGIFAISAFQAAVQSFDAPARQSWVPLLVPREYVGNAIGLNSIAFNAPSVVGPPMAGILIVFVGIATSFYVNAVLTAAVIVAVIMMSPGPPLKKPKREPFVRSLTTGIRFLAAHRVLRWVIVLLLVTSMLVRPYTLLLPAFAVHDLHTGPQGLGVLMAAAGFGAIGGAVVTAMLSSRRRGTLWFSSAALLGVCISLLGTFAAFWPALFVLFFLGLSAMTMIGTSNVLIQTLSPDEVRGRAISVYSMIMIGLIPLGTLVVGSIGSATGLRAAFILAGFVTVACTAGIWFAEPEMRRI